MKPSRGSPASAAALRPVARSVSTFRTRQFHGYKDLGRRGRQVPAAATGSDDGISVVAAATISLLTRPGPGSPSPPRRE